MIEEIADSILKSIRIFLQAMVKLRTEDLFTYAEQICMQEGIALCLKDNDDCLGKLNRLLDETDGVPEGHEVLNDLCLEAKNIRVRAEKFEGAFMQLCRQRQEALTGIKNLFEINQNETAS